MQGIFLFSWLLLEPGANKALDLGLLCFAFQRGEYVRVGPLVELERQTLYMCFLIPFLRCFFPLDYIHTLSGIGAVARPVALIFKRLL